MNCVTTASINGSTTTDRARAIALRIFVCNLLDEVTTTQALRLLTTNQDADVGLADLGLEPVEFAADSLAAAEVEEIVSRTAADIADLVGDSAAVYLRQARELHGRLHDVLVQLDLIGVPDWKGAEGLSLVDARESLMRLSSLAPDPSQIEQAHHEALRLELEATAPPAND